MRKKITFALLSLLLVPLGMMAQNVTVHPGNGSMMATRKTGGGDTFFNWGGFATWKHNQLSLTMTTGDSNNNLNGNNGANNPLTASGQLSNHANDIFASAEDSNHKQYLQLGKGNGMDTYLTFALPKGYRFTGYTIIFHRISEPNGAQGDIENYNGSISFGETNNSFTYRSTSNTSGTYRGDIAQDNTEQYTLSRTSQTDTDMDNLLYFRLSNNKTSGRAFIQLDHVEFYFTAEANYAPITPTTTATNRSAVDISFTTSKMNYGTLTPQSDGGEDRISYGGTVSDLNANLILYEDGSVTNDQNNGFDGTVGKMVAYNTGSISSQGNYFKLDSKSHGKPTATGEAIYFIETPIWATNSTSANSHKEPIGYRIVGASFDYAPGTGTAYIPATFYIRYVDGGVTYGLNYYSGQFNLNNQSVWSIDQDGYIYYGSGNQIRYLSVGNDGVISVERSKPNANAGTFEVVENNGIKQIRRKNYPTQYFGWEEVTESFLFWSNTYWRPVIVQTEENRVFYDEQSPAQEATTGQYTLKIYDETGTRVKAERVVSGTGGTVTVSGYNNDAIKIGIVGTGLINGHLTLQALDPYIDHVDIVCQEDGGQGGKLTQQFNATDFAVRGGKFTFYVPQDFKAPAKFTFENLYSHYGDNTYYNANNSPENHARYFFVGSTYSGYDANVYNRYKDHSDADYTTKIACLKPGNISFNFNNAATVTTDGGVYQEYPFSVALYQQEGGNFNNDFIFEQAEMNGNTTKTAYLFTCDETRYNIAPTTATQHVYYAYYQMDIDMQKRTYVPQLAWEKLYNETFYSADNSTIKRDAKFGLKLTTTPVTDDQGTHSGYLTVTQILDYINGRDAIGTEGDDDYVAAIPTALTGGDNAPSSMDQILFIDGSDLMSIVENETAKLDDEGNPVMVDGKPQYDSHPISQLKESLDVNALIYLPYGSKSEVANVAYNTIAQYSETNKNFRGASNIVIADRYPFYAPYDIQVEAANMAKYERTVTNPDLYGDDDQHLTIVLPFEINVDNNGKHTNNDGAGSPFTLALMNEENSLSKNPDAQIDFGADAYFTKISGDHSEANKPYVVTMQGTAGESAFKVHVNGALVKATPDKTGILTGETASGTYKYTEDDVEKTVEYNFTHKGTYTGIEIGKDGGAATASTTVFYFANNYFLDSKTLVNGKSLKMLPYRSYYEYPSSAKAKMVKFRIVFGDVYIPISEHYKEEVWDFLDQHTLA